MEKRWKKGLEKYGISFNSNSKKIKTEEGDGIFEENKIISGLEFNSVKPWLG